MKKIKLKNVQKILRGASTLYSKRPELYFNKLWPNFFEKSKNVYLWDLNGKKYLDFIFAVGTNTLGYSNPKINAAVIRSIKQGNMTSLNCPEEYMLAKELLSIHKWADEAKFARSGGEANSIAIRLARSYSTKQNIALCGYHGWHDWYLASNFGSKKNLSKHLMPNVSTVGVSKKLKNTTFTFKYNDFDKLRYLVNNKKIGIVIMEVYRNIEPKNNFLKKVRKLCNKKNIVLIFDECTSGFRNNYGGLHLLYGVNPDLAMFGKAIGNGHAITAVIGKKKIMKSAKDSFISSTFWGERSGYVAALTTLKEMKRIKSWKKILSNGNYLIEEIKKLGKIHNLQIEFSGKPSFFSFNFNSKNNNKYKFLLIDYFLKRNILASNVIYLSIFHNKKNSKAYLKYLDEVFKIISDCEKNLININKLVNLPKQIKELKRYN